MNCIHSVLPGVKEGNPDLKSSRPVVWIECAKQGKAAIGWDEKYNNPDWHKVPGKPHLRKGIGVCTSDARNSNPLSGYGRCQYKINEDGSFNFLIGATDLGTGSDTVLGQMAAEVLGVPLGGYDCLFF